MHDKRWIMAWAAGCALLVGVAFVGGLLVNNPWESAISNSQRTLPVTATVEERTISEDRPPIEGVIHQGTTIDVPAPPAAEDAARHVITAVFKKAGDTISSGEALVETSGRPLLVLTLPVPLYRDLQAGDAGDDVTQLQTALILLGHLAGPSDGSYGPATAAAVARLYAANNVSPPAVPSVVADELALAKNALTTARADLKAAQSTPSASLPDNGSEIAHPTDGGGDGIATLRQAVLDLEAAYGALQAASIQRLAAAEVIALPTQSARIASIAALGSDLSGADAPIAQLWSGDPYISARISADQTDAFTSGAPVTLAAADDDGLETTGTISSVGAFSDGSEDPSGTTIPGYPVTITIAPWDEMTDGRTVLISAHTAQEQATGPAIPISALRQDDSGKYVELVDADDGSGQATTKHVAVTIAAQGDGFAVLSSGEIKSGDKVLVGAAR